MIDNKSIFPHSIFLTVNFCISDGDNFQYDHDDIEDRKRWWCWDHDDAQDDDDDAQDDDDAVKDDDNDSNLLVTCGVPALAWGCHCLAGPEQFWN